MSGYTIIDVDTHVTESPDLWTSRAPAGCVTKCRASRPAAMAACRGSWEAPRCWPALV